MKGKIHIVMEDVEKCGIEGPMPFAFETLTSARIFKRKLTMKFGDSCKYSIHTLELRH